MLVQGDAPSGPDAAARCRRCGSALQRARERNAAAGSRLRIASRCSVSEFFERVRDAYLARAAAEPGRIAVIDASRSADEVTVQICRRIGSQIMDFLSADSLPWLQEPQQRVRAALQPRRLPHSLLLLSAPGLGAEQSRGLDRRARRCATRRGRAAVRCMRVVPCLMRADTHPDVHVVRVEEDAQQIKVDQVRELIESLSLSRAIAGGYKVGVIEGAESLNANGANAFLKTLGGADARHHVDHDRETESPLAGHRCKPLPASAICARRRSRRREHGLPRARPASRTGTRRSRSRRGAPLLALELGRRRASRSSMTRCSESLAAIGARCSRRDPAGRALGEVQSGACVSLGLRTGSHSAYDAVLAARNFASNCGTGPLACRFT